MNSTVYIIGTSHPIQCGVDEREGAASAFEETLRQACRDHGINRIAEEMSCAGLVSHGVTECIGQKVAKLLGIPHHAVDLEPKESASLSLGDSAAIRIVMTLSFADGGAPFGKLFQLSWMKRGNAAGLAVFSRKRRGQCSSFVARTMPGVFSLAFAASGLMQACFMRTMSPNHFFYPTRYSLG